MAGTILKETGASSDIVPAPQDYASRLAALLAIDDSKVSLIQELITEHSAQQSVINSLKLELEDERDTKEKWRGRFMEREKDVESMVGKKISRDDVFCKGVFWTDLGLWNRIGIHTWLCW